jgi:transposase InsO family protein
MANYPQEFKDLVVQLHHQGHSFKDLDREFNLSGTSISNWVRTSQRREGEDAKSEAADDEPVIAKIRRLGRQLDAKELRLVPTRAPSGTWSLRGQPCPDRTDPAAPPSRRPEILDLVHRDFHADVPNAMWFTDITQIRTGQGWLYAAVILDAFNREVITWAVAGYDTPNTAMTAMTAMTEAIRIRRPPPGCVIHSDRG